MNESKIAAYFYGFKDISIRLIVKPADFFRSMPKTGGIIEPLLYVVTTSLLSAVLMAVESFFTRGVGLHDLGMLVGGLIAVPLVTVILSFFVAGICYAAWAFMGSKENFETSYRCLAYMQILAPITVLFSIVPYLGLLGIAWWLYLMVIATREVHKAPMQPALLVFGILAAMLGLIYFSAVNSAMNSRTHLKEFTKELQKMPATSDPSNFKNR